MRVYGKSVSFVSSTTTTTTTRVFASSNGGGKRYEGKELSLA